MTKKTVGTNDYRMEGRSVEEFSALIKAGNDRELKAIELFEKYLRNVEGYNGEIKPNGCDMTGEFIEDISKITTDPDFAIGSAELGLEVKVSRSHTMTIYLKVSQLKAYVKKGSWILYVNGLERDIPAFTLWTPEDIENILATCPHVKPPNGINGGKLSVEIDALEYAWKKFDGGWKQYVKR